MKYNIVYPYNINITSDSFSEAAKKFINLNSHIDIKKLIMKDFTDKHVYIDVTKINNKLKLKVYNINPKDLSSDIQSFDIKLKEMHLKNI